MSATIADLGSASAVANATTISHTTNQAAAPGSKVLTAVAWDTVALTLQTVSYGGVNGVIIGTSVSGAVNVALVYFDVTVTLASGATILATFSGSAGSRYIMSNITTGLVAGDPASKNLSAGATGTAWTLSLPTQSSGLAWGACYNASGFDAPTNAPAGFCVELHDIVIAGDSSVRDEYTLAVGSDAVIKGTLSISEAWRAIAAYWPGAGSGSGLRFPLGV